MHPSVSDALDAALPSTFTMERDLATVALARRLAHDIDDADLVHVDFLAAVADLPASVDDVLRRRLMKLGARIESTAVLASLAPKLTTVLVELGMTPASRASLVKGQPTHGPGGRPDDEDELDRARRERAERGRLTGPR